MCSVKWVVCPSVETVEGMPPRGTNTVALSCGRFACLHRETEGRLPPSTEKAIPSVPRMFDNPPPPPPPATPGYRRERSDCSNHHVQGVFTTGRLILKAPCPVKVEGGEREAEGR